MGYNIEWLFVDENDKSTQLATTSGAHLADIGPVSHGLMATLREKAAPAGSTAMNFELELRDSAPVAGLPAPAPAGLWVYEMVMQHQLADKTVKKSVTIQGAHRMMLDTQARYFRVELTNLPAAGTINDRLQLVLREKRKYTVEFRILDDQGNTTKVTRTTGAHLADVGPVSSGLMATLMEQAAPVGTDEMNFVLELKDSAPVAGLPAPTPAGLWDYEMVMQHQRANGSVAKSVTVRGAHRMMLETDARQFEVELKHLPPTAIPDRFQLELREKAAAGSPAGLDPRQQNVKKR